MATCVGNENWEGEIGTVSCEKAQRRSSELGELSSFCMEK
jgi:hypothetical protein